MSQIADHDAFAQETFGHAELGDLRLTRRLVDATAALAARPSASIPAACENDSARVQGFYKLIRNDDVDPEKIQEAGFEATVRAANGYSGDILLIQDTTSISPAHPLREELRSKAGSPAGYEVHTGLLVSSDLGVPIGILGQLVWSRAVRKSERLMEVESEKWQRLDEQTFSRDVDQHRFIRVCDRESDYWAYIDFLVRNTLRFVVRAAQNRLVGAPEEVGYLWDAAQQAPVIGTRMIRVEQRGSQKAGLEQSAREARPRREVRTTLRAVQVELNGPKREKSIALNLVYVTDDDGELEWLLLTSEPILTLSDVSKIVAHYEKRWLIEQFHKALKTGCGIEQRRMGSLDNYLRVMAITMPIAVRILKLQVLANLPDVTIPATELLSPPEIAVAWRKVEGTAPPETSPSCLWAYRSIAKLAGWADSKRTGRIGLDTLWRGVERLSGLVEGWRLATEHER